MRPLFVAGTGSGAGKSTVCTALCRLFAREGYAVMPFKALNISMNSEVTDEGHEIAHAQYIQAKACGVEATPEMNPVLIKPGREGARLVIMGREAGRIRGGDAFSWDIADAREAVAYSIRKLMKRCDLLIMEGTGSPAEINLEDRDISNLYAAGVADADMMLVADIDRGGAFAAIQGTWSLLHGRCRLKYYMFNRFRGREEMLWQGVHRIEGSTGMHFLGALPHLGWTGISDEDTPIFPVRRGRVRVVVPRTPCMSNWGELDWLARVRDLSLVCTENAEEARSADMVMLAGSRSTCADLEFIRESGFSDALLERVHERRPLLGICGGYQMLTERIEDPVHVESGEAMTRGLGLLEGRTLFGEDKKVARISGVTLGKGIWTEGQSVNCFEMHHGTVVHREAKPFALMERENGRVVKRMEGCVRGAVAGTNMHDLFCNEGFLRSFVRALFSSRGLEYSGDIPEGEKSIDALADAAAEHLDLTELLNRD